MRTLVEFHQVGIHLDFKPQNVIVVESIEKVKSFKLIDFDASIVYLDEHKKGKGTKKSLHYTERFAAPELFQELSSNDSFVEVTPKMDIWPAGITIFQMAFSKVRQFNSPFHKMVAVELFCCVKLKPDTELLSRIKNLELQEVNAHVGSEEWWKTYWQMIGDMLTVWHEMPEIVFLSKNMLSIEPEKRMAAKGIIDYLEGKLAVRQLRTGNCGSYICGRQLRTTIAADNCGSYICGRQLRTTIAADNCGSYICGRQLGTTIAVRTFADDNCGLYICGPYFCQKINWKGGPRQYDPFRITNSKT
ncbi:hypothetical protein niasHT_020156 [Heterodera trifolii]